MASEHPADSSSSLPLRLRLHFAFRSTCSDDASSSPSSSTTLAIATFVVPTINAIHHFATVAHSLTSTSSASPASPSSPSSFSPHDVTLALSATAISRITAWHIHALLRYVLGEGCDDNPITIPVDCNCDDDAPRRTPVPLRERAQSAPSHAPPPLHVESPTRLLSPSRDSPPTTSPAFPPSPPPSCTTATSASAIPTTPSCATSTTRPLPPLRLLVDRDILDSLVLPTLHIAHALGATTVLQQCDAFLCRAYLRSFRPRSGDVSSPVCIMPMELLVDTLVLAHRFRLNALSHLVQHDMMMYANRRESSESHGSHGSHGSFESHPAFLAARSLLDDAMILPRQPARAPDAAADGWRAYSLSKAPPDVILNGALHVSRACCTGSASSAPCDVLCYLARQSGLPAPCSSSHAAQQPTFRRVRPGGSII